MGEYQSNSDRAKNRTSEPPVKRAEKAITGNVALRKAKGLGRLKDAFIANDFDDIKTYIFSDVLIPTIKRAFLDILCNGAGMLLGEKNPIRGGSPASKVSYRAYYERPDERPSGSTLARRSYDDLIFETRGDAEVVLERMFELLERFDSVSVADLYDLAGQSSAYTDNKYGWTDLRDARVQSVRGGYAIVLPRATTL